MQKIVAKMKWIKYTVVRFWSESDMYTSSPTITVQYSLNTKCMMLYDLLRLSLSLKSKLKKNIPTISSMSNSPSSMATANNTETKYPVELQDRNPISSPQIDSLNPSPNKGIPRMVSKRYMETPKKDFIPPYSLCSFSLRLLMRRNKYTTRARNSPAGINTITV